MAGHPFSLRGLTVLVVGASSGIGAAAARLASTLGARVLLASRRPEALEAVRAGLARPADAATIAMDSLDLASIGAGLAGASTIDHLLVSAVADENAKRGALAAMSLMANPPRRRRGAHCRRRAPPAVRDRGLHLKLAPNRRGTAMLIG